MKFVVMLALGFLLISSQDAFSIPPQISISGFLEDSNTTPATPMQGDYHWELRFYDGQTTAAHQIGTATTGTVTVESGVFSITLAPPAGLLGKNDVWYTLAIDTNKNGIGQEDLFGERFRVTSVLYSQSGAPAEYFTAQSGWTGDYGFTEPPSSLTVVPFMTPPGGVHFNKIATWISEPHWGWLSYGIYDSTGRLVVGSGKQNVATSALLHFVISSDTPETYLEPSKLYFTAYTAHGSFGIASGPQPPIAGFGVVRNIVVNDELPAQFNPNNIILPSYLPLAIPIAMTMVPH